MPSRCTGRGTSAGGGEGCGINGGAGGGGKGGATGAGGGMGGSGGGAVGTYDGRSTLLHIRSRLRAYATAIVAMTYANFHAELNVSYLMGFEA